MKRFIFGLIAIFVVNFSLGQVPKFTINVKDGKGNAVSIEQPDIYFSKLQKTIGEGKFNYYMQEIVDKCKKDCKYPITFVPTNILFHIKDTVSIKIDTIDVILYRYSYLVKGYAKNGFGVECAVDKVDMSKDTMPSKHFDDNIHGKVAKRTFFDEYAPKFIVATKGVGVYNESDYELLSETSIFKDKKIEQFEYNNWKYYIIIYTK